MKTGCRERSGAIARDWFLARSPNVREAPRLMTRPMEPASPCSSMRTTERRKFESVSCGIATRRPGTSVCTEGSFRPSPSRRNPFVPEAHARADASLVPALVLGLERLGELLRVERLADEQ